MISRTRLCIWLAIALAVPAVSAADESAASAPTAARRCLNDLRAFDDHMKMDGYWLHAADYGYGYPMYGANYPYAEYGPVGGQPGPSAFVDARPGYDVRSLLAAAHILASRGQQKACEALLTETRGVYQDYLIDMRNAHIAKGDVPAWREHLIAKAVPVSADTSSIRFDDLIGMDVVNSQNVGLGSIDDVLLNRKTGQIAYLVLGRGGVFGIDEKYVPVPWSDFRRVASGMLMVLDTSKASLDSAPEMTKRIFGSDVHFAPDNSKVDEYWKTRVAH